MRVALLPIGFGVGALLCRILLKQTPSVYSVDLAQPLAVVTYWQHFGLLMWLTLFVAIAIASVGYWATLTRPPGVLTIVTVSALSCAAALAFPVIFSSDVYAYGGYGWLALHGVSPYAHAEVLARNQLMNAVLWQWGNPPPVCVYGPAFVWFAQAIVAIFAGFGAGAPLWALRVSACAALVLCAALAFDAFPQRTRAAAAAGIALNPIAIWSAAEGHNDAFLLAIVLAGFALISRGRAFTGAVVIAMSALVKAPGLLAAAVAAFPFAATLRSRRVTGTVFGLAASAIIASPAMAQLSHNAGNGRYFPQFSLQYALNAAFGETAALALAAALSISLTIGGCILLWKGNPNGAALPALALWLIIPNPYPWYALWVLPLAFVCSGPARWALLALTIASIVRYLPDSTSDVPQSVAAAVALVPPAAAVLVFIISSRNRRTGRERLKACGVASSTCTTAARFKPRP